MKKTTTNKNKSKTQKKKPNHKEPQYLPSQLEIKEGCAAIKHEWTPEEANRRAGGLLVAAPYSVPVVNDVRRLSSRGM